MKIINFSLNMLNLPEINIDRQKIVLRLDQKSWSTTTKIAICIKSSYVVFLSLRFNVEIRKDLVRLSCKLTTNSSTNNWINHLFYVLNFEYWMCIRWNIEYAYVRKKEQRRQLTFTVQKQGKEIQKMNGKKGKIKIYRMSRIIIKCTASIRMI